MTRRRRRTRADRDALERVQWGVYRTAGARPTWEHQLLAACLAARASAVASHRAAAVLWGLAELDDLARPGRRGLGALRQVLEARALGDQRCDSLLEPLFADIMATTGVEIAYQYPIVVDGRRYVVDFAVPTARLVATRPPICADAGDAIRDEVIELVATRRPAA